MIWNTPPFDAQSSNDIDIDDCVPESLVHIIFGLTGIRYSPRALASLMYHAGKLDSNGSSTDDAIEVANQYGFIPYENWPTPDSFTHDSYLAPVPAEVLATAQFYAIKKIDPNLNKSPLWTQLSFPRPTGSLLHWVDQFNSTQYLDSEPGGAVKPLSYGGAVILSQHSIEITKKGEPMHLENDNGTIYLVGRQGKLGIADGPALDLMKSIDGEIDTGSTSGLPQIGTLTHNDAFIIHK